MGFISITPFGLATHSPTYGSNPSSYSRRTNENVFSANLEHRIRDYKSGRHDYTDGLVDAEIASRDVSVTTALSNSDPGALRNYSSLLSGLTYDKSARVVSSVEFTIRHLSNIPTQEEAQAETDKIVEAFKQREEKPPAA